MKKTRKTIFGVLGLFGVMAMTTCAVFMPGPEASATSTSVTDTITVRVVGSVPNVDILGIENREIVTVPLQSFTMNYENSHTVTLRLKHTDLYGHSQTFTLDEIDADYNAGSETYNLRFVESGGEAADA